METWEGTTPDNTTGGYEYETRKEIFRSCKIN